MFSRQYFLSTLLSTAIAAPLADPYADASSSGGWGIPCSTSFHYQSLTVTNQFQTYTNSFVGGVSVSSGNSVSYSEGYSIGFTVTEGASIGVTFEEVFSLGIDASVSETTTTTTTEGATVPCPSGGGWTCAVSIVF